MQKHPKQPAQPKPNSPRANGALNRSKKSRPRANAKTSDRSPAPGAAAASALGQDFLSLVRERISESELASLDQRKHAAGRPATRLRRSQLLVALIFHCTVSYAGSFGRHLLLCLGIQMAESTLSERRQALPFAVFQELLARLLGPVANADRAASFKGLRLVALDGVGFSLPNTPQVQARCQKGGNQKGRVAFAKLQGAALVELAWHNPLAAALGWEGQSEWKLAGELLDRLPAHCLLLADRLYGCGAFITAAIDRLAPQAGHFLFRVKESLKAVRRGRRFQDGSREVEIHALDPKNHHRVTRTLRVREIRATLQRPGFRAVKIRLWTSLSCAQGSARELVALYSRRWEQELYFRELKQQLGTNDLLRSQTPETAAQEVAAMIIGSSLVAHERAKLKPGEALPQRVSFLKTWELLEPLWLTLLLGADLLSAEQKQALGERFYHFAATAIMQKKRARSCPRVMRQPAQPWPRKRDQKSHEGTIQITVNPDPA
jgi:hypothetical protein